MAASGRDGPARMTRRQAAVVALGQLAVAFALMHAAWAHPLTSVVGPTVVDGPGYGARGLANGDSLQLLWLTRWTPYALTHLHDPLFTSFLNAPHGANLMWDALMPVATTVLAPVTLLAGASVGLNLLATLAVFLCGVTATACARRFVRRAWAAVVCGLAFELSPFVLAQSQGHQSIVLGAALLPCVVLLVHDTVVSQQRSTAAGGVLLSVVAAAMLYTWEETLLAAALMGVIGVLVAAACAPRATGAALPSLLRVTATAAVIGGALALPGVAFQFLGPGHLAGNAIRPADVWVIDLQNVVTPTSVQLLAPGAALAASHAWTGDGFEWGGYLGVPLLLAVVLAAAVQWRRAAVRWLCAMLVIGVVLSLGPSVHVGGHDTGVWLPWAWLSQLTLVRDILAARLAVFAALAAALLLAVALDALVERRRGLVAGLVAVVVGASLLPSPPPAQPVSAPAFFTGPALTRVPEGSTVLVAPYATPLDAQAMVWQEAAGMRFRMPEGYISVPDSGGGLLESPASTVTSTTMLAVAAGHTAIVDAVLRTAILSDLQRWSVRTVVVGPMDHASTMRQLFTSVLGWPPENVGGVAVWWDV